MDDNMDTNQDNEGSSEHQIWGKETNESQEFQPPAPPIKTQPYTSVNTGPKGVLADYEQAKQVMRARLISEKIERERIMNRMAVGEEKFEITSEEADEKQRRHITTKIDNNESDSEEGSDDEIFQKYKLERILAIQNSPNYFGKLEQISSTNELVKILKQTSSNTHVVLALLNPLIESCVRMDYALQNLSNQFPAVRFLKAKSTDIIPGYKDEGLPTLLIYKNSEQIQEYIRVTSKIGDSFSDKDLFIFLGNKGILSKNKE